MVRTNSPLTILIAIHYYCGKKGVYAWWNPAHAQSPAVIEIKEDMERRGLLILNEKTSYADTDYIAVQEPLKLYIDELCRVPFPLMKWSMPEKETECLNSQSL